MSTNYRSETQVNYLGSDAILHQPFEQQVLKSPDAVAVIFEDQQLTYKELDNRANQLAHYLQSLGVGPEVLVGMFMERSPNLIVSILGILKAGGVCVPMDTSDPKERLDFILVDTKASVLLTEDCFLRELPNDNRHTISMDKIWVNLANERVEAPISEVTPENLAFVFYASGSTGTPKGVMLSHKACSNGHVWVQKTLLLSMEDRILFKASVFAGLVKEFFLLLGVGGALVVAPPNSQKDSFHLIELIAKHNITIIAITPSQLQVLIEENLLLKCSNLKHVMCSAEPLPLKLQEHFLASQTANLYNTYGVTEVGPHTTFWPCKCTQNVVPIGRPIDDVQIYILDSNLQRVPVETPGEIYIGGKGLAQGYLNQPRLTDERFIPNPFSNQPGERLYKTGDLGRYLSDGNIEHLGRADRQVKIRGFRIELEEVELVLSQHPAIEQAVVVIREDISINNYLVAYIVLHEKQKCKISELRHFLNQKLPSYMVPSVFVILSIMPLTPNGKIDYHALPIPDRTGKNSEECFVASRDDIELQLVKLWEEILNVHPISIRDDFFHLGGNSLLAVHLFTQIEKIFGETLPLITIFQAATVEKIANIIRK
ncbi:hypothetical protein NUACC21_52920 [Scytonema sp. NUACC21]